MLFRSILEPLFQKLYEYIENHEVEMKELLRVSQLENKLNVRMIEVVPKVEPSLNKNKEHYLLEQIVYYTRKKAQDIYNCNIIEDSLRTRSLEFSNLIVEIAKGLQVPAIVVDIGSHFHFPYSHYVVIAYDSKEFYLIDCTYQQFFLLGYNFKNRYYPHPSYIRTCEMGGRIMEEHLDTAIRMIKEGFLPVHSLDFQYYCDVCAEYGNVEKCVDGISYLKELLKPIERSSDKVDRILVSKMQYL